MTYWPANNHDGLQEQLGRDWGASNDTVNISVCGSVMRLAFGNGRKYFAAFSSNKEAEKSLAQINRELGHP